MLEYASKARKSSTPGPPQDGVDIAAVMLVSFKIGTHGTYGYMCVNICAILGQICKGKVTHRIRSGWKLCNICSCARDAQDQDGGPDSPTG